MANRESKTVAEDAKTLRKLVNKYRDQAQSAGVDPESVTIGEALRYLQTGEVPERMQYAQY